MIEVLFICHGNICRSPMAEFVFRDMVQKAGFGDKIRCASAATSSEELGNGVHPGTRAVLETMGINCAGKVARKLVRADYNRYDWLVCMDHANITNAKAILGPDHLGKVRLLLSFAGSEGQVADPWYTRNFDVTKTDVVRGCEGLLHHIVQSIEEVS